METEQKPADYEAVLADLETKREELDNAIAVIKRMLGQAPSSPGHSAQKHHHGDKLTSTSFFGLGLADATKKYLAIAKEPKTAPEIADALLNHGITSMSKNFTATVFSALDRNPDFVRPKRGLWGLKEWYPGARIKKENGEDKELPVTKEEVSDSGSKPPPHRSVPQPKKQS